MQNISLRSGIPLYVIRPFVNFYLFTDDDPKINPEGNCGYKYIYSGIERPLVYHDNRKFADGYKQEEIKDFSSMSVTETLE